MAGATPPRTRSAGRRQDAARLLASWVGITGAVVLVGAALTGPLSGSVGALDNDLARDVAARRSDTVVSVAQAVSLLGETWTEAVLEVVLLAGTWLWLRRLRAVVFLAVAVLGELAAYLLTVETVRRHRPPVPVLDPGLDPLHSYPSGHVAAAVATYGALAVLTWTHAGRLRRRWGAGPVVGTVVGLVVLPPAVALARLCLGAHHLTDVLASLCFMTAWLAVTRAVLLRGPADADVLGTHGRGLH